MIDGIPEDPLPIPPPVGRTSVSPDGKSVADRTGVYLPWRWVWALVGFFIASGTIWTAFGLATVDNLSDHNVAAAAHEVVLEKDTEPVPIATAVKRRHVAAKAHQGEYRELKKGYDVIAVVKIDLDTDRAERLADRAADKVRNSTRSREVWKTVRDAALQNLSAKPKRPIRDGLERYLD